jgi:hypothetical protein
VSDVHVDRFFSFGQELERAANEVGYSSETREEPLDSSGSPKYHQFRTSANWGEKRGGAHAAIKVTFIECNREENVCRFRSTLAPASR